MVKRRPVVVVSPKTLKRGQLVTVVPLSTKAPSRQRSFHHKLDPASLPPPFADDTSWAKCDMLYTVGFQRLDLPQGKRKGGKRSYYNHRVTEADLKAIYDAIVAGLGLNRQLAHPIEPPKAL